MPKALKEKQERKNPESSPNKETARAVTFPKLTIP